MSKKTLLGIPMLCLSLQSTGYAAEAFLKGIELSRPVLRRAMSTFRPYVSNIVEPATRQALQAPKRFFFMQPTAIQDKVQPASRVLSTLTSISHSVISNPSKFSSILDQNRTKQIHVRTFATASIKRDDNGDFIRAYETAQTNCFPTLTSAYPELKDPLNRINSTFFIMFNYVQEKVERIDNMILSQLSENAEIWFSLNKKIDTSNERLRTSKEGIDNLFREALRKS